MPANATFEFVKKKLKNLSKNLRTYKVCQLTL